MSMNWEVINGISTVVSAICATISLTYMLYPQKKREKSLERLISLEKFMHFLLASSGWILVCMSFLWVFEPYGTFPIESEYRNFYGVLLSFPALIILITGIKLLQTRDADK